MLALDRYLFKTLSSSLLFSVGLFLCLDVLFAIIAELNDIRGAYTIGDVFYFITLTIPGRIYELFPLTAVVAVVISLGTLASGSELVVMLASGFGKMRIASSVLIAVGFWLIWVVVIGEFVSPAGEKMANTFRAQEISDGQGIATESSVWIRDGTTIFNARRLIKGQAATEYVLEGVTVFEFKDNKAEKISRASTAFFNNGQWLLKDLEVSIFDEGGVKVDRFKEQQWQSRIEPEILNISLIRPKYLSLRDINKLQQFAGKDEQLLSAYQVAWWSKWFFPVFVLVIALCGVPFVFGQLRSGGFGQRLVIGAMLGVVMYLMNKTLLNVGEVYHVHPSLVVVLPSVLIATVAIWSLRRTGHMR
ncbi:LPS export ABC transporter permease LptG [Marinicella sp. W31]|uniref:LPS export ABC transporter permease LptG n=1 Tax=Marinicella sp. W31 TaxID=3023713 RepID=UPI003757F02D